MLTGGKTGLRKLLILKVANGSIWELKWNLVLQKKNISYTFICQITLSGTGEAGIMNATDDY